MRTIKFTDKMNRAISVSLGVEYVKTEDVHISVDNEYCPPPTNLGVPHTEEAKAKMRGRTPWNKGKTGVYSEETRRKWREQRKGVYPTAAAAANRGRKPHNYLGQETKTCSVCGNDFTIEAVTRKRFCSRSCAATYSNLNRSK